MQSAHATHLHLVDVLDILFPRALGPGILLSCGCCC